MKGNPSLWRRSLAHILVLAILAALAPLPAAAADQNPPTGLKASVTKIAATERLVGPKSAPKAKPDQAASEVSLQSGSFFKTPAGLVVLAVVAAGTGYAVYSTSHDRVKSQVR